MVNMTVLPLVVSLCLLGIARAKYLSEGIDDPAFSQDGFESNPKDTLELLEMDKQMYSNNLMQQGQIPQREMMQTALGNMPGPQKNKKVKGTNQSNPLLRPKKNKKIPMLPGVSKKNKKNQGVPYPGLLKPSKTMPQIIPDNTKPSMGPVFLGKDNSIHQPPPITGNKPSRPIAAPLIYHDNPNYSGSPSIYPDTFKPRPLLPLTEKPPLQRPMVPLEWWKRPSPNRWPAQGPPAHKFTRPISLWQFPDSDDELPPIPPLPPLPPVWPLPDTPSNWPIPKRPLFSSDHAFWPYLPLPLPPPYLPQRSDPFPHRIPPIGRPPGRFPASKNGQGFFPYLPRPLGPIPIIPVDPPKTLPTPQQAPHPLPYPPPPLHTFNLQRYSHLLRPVPGQVLPHQDGPVYPEPRHHYPPIRKPFLPPLPAHWPTQFPPQDDPPNIPPWPPLPVPKRWNHTPDVHDKMIRHLAPSLIGQHPWYSKEFQPFYGVPSMHSKASYSPYIKEQSHFEPNMKPRFNQLHDNPSEFVILHYV